MNNTRRKELQRLVVDRLANARGELDMALADLEALRDEEQESFDALPEGLQASEQGERSSEAASALDDAYSTLESALESFDEVEGAIEQATS